MNLGLVEHNPDVLAGIEFLHVHKVHLTFLKKKAI